MLAEAVNEAGGKEPKDMDGEFRRDAGENDV
jgi:hypothetical protein